MHKYFLFFFFLRFFTKFPSVQLIVKYYRTNAFTRHQRLQFATHLLIMKFLAILRGVYARYSSLSFSILFLWEMLAFGS